MTAIGTYQLKNKSNDLIELDFFRYYAGLLASSFFFAQLLSRYAYLDIIESRIGKLKLFLALFGVDFRIVLVGESYYSLDLLDPFYHP